MNHPVKTIIALCITALMLNGCITLTPGPRQDDPIAMPHGFSLYTDTDPGPGTWWHSFSSPELDSLVQQALAGNFDIRTALSKVRQAEAAARKAGADLSPTIDYSGSAQTSREQTKTDAKGRSSEDAKEFSAGLSAGYEVDLWGRLNALHKAEITEYQATKEDLDAAAVTVSADVATAWIDILSLRRQINILNQQIETNQRMLSLQELRFENGQSDALDVSQQRDVLAQAKALMPPLQLGEAQQLNALAVLLGLAGKGDAIAGRISQSDLPDLIPLPQTGLPADLLASRPDVRAAGLRLNEKDWQVCAAKADRLPALDLSASAIFSSASLDLLFSNWVSTLAASITGPVFDAGYRSAEVDRAKAEADQYLTAYARTVAQAVQEVEDSLATERRQTEYIRLLKEQLATLRITVNDAHLQYMNGQDNYLDYLSAWINVQALERQLVDEQATLIKNRVTLYRTLGGDWTRGLSQADTTETPSKNS